MLESGCKKFVHPSPVVTGCPFTPLGPDAPRQQLTNIVCWLGQDLITALLQVRTPAEAGAPALVPAYRAAGMPRSRAIYRLRFRDQALARRPDRLGPVLRPQAVAVCAPRLPKSCRTGSPASPQGYHHTLAITCNGRPSCGARNASGQLSAWTTSA
jgi:hypothetical protein